MAIFIGACFIAYLLYSHYKYTKKYAEKEWKRKERLRSQGYDID